MRNESERACFEARAFLKSKMLRYYLAFTNIDAEDYIKKGQTNIASFESATAY